MPERSLWVDPPPQHPEIRRPPEPPRPPEAEPDPEPGPDLRPDLRATLVAVAIGVIGLSTVLGISGDWFSTGPGVSYLGAWSGAVLVATTLVLIAAVVRMLLAERDASLAVGIAALVWAGQVVALLTGLGEEAAEVGGGAVGAAIGLPVALALALDGIASGRTPPVPRRTLLLVGFGLGVLLAAALTTLPLGDEQTRITIIP